MGFTVYDWNYSFDLSLGRLHEIPLNNAQEQFLPHRTHSYSFIHTLSHRSLLAK
jgi:hypothetical protein